MKYEELGTMGRYARQYKPRVLSYHRTVNDLFAEPSRRVLFPSAMVMQQKKFPDVSFYQGAIDYSLMRQKTDAIIIRAGQNEWKDSQFDNNWRLAREHGMKRGSYWFYDDRKSPGRQADLWADLLRDDMPEMEILADWENSYGGQFSGLRNVVAFMQAMENRLPGVRIGMYTGYYWFVEHSNAVTNASQYSYLRSRPLFEGWYTDNPANVLIPNPWTSIFLWQFGTPAVGEEYGVATKELDMNYINMTEADFQRRYGVPTPPEQPEVTMRYEATNIYPDMSLRDGHDTAATVIRKYPAGFTFRGEETWTAPVDAYAGLNQINKAGDVWLRVLSVNGVPATGWVAVTHLGKKFCNLVDTNPQPPASEPPRDAVVTMPDGSKWRAGTWTRVG